MNNIYIKIAIMCLTLYSIRVLPFLFLRKEIKNKYIKSFLSYIPYVTLAIMTFPAILSTTDNKISGFLAFIIGIIVAWRGGNIFVVASSCCFSILLTEYIISII